MHNSLIINVLASVIAVFGPSILTAQEGCSLVLRGQVTEAQTGAPLAFSTIFLAEKKKGATADEQGFFEIKNLCAGQISLEIRHLECAHSIQKMELLENSSGQIFAFRLDHRIDFLDAVTVAASALPAQKIAENALSKADLAAAQGKSLGETLEKLPGVRLLATGATIQKPIIEGLHSNRIAILQNGVALEGQQWGSEHAPEIDPFSAGKISVVRGAAGVRFGAAGIGGAVVVEPAPLTKTAVPSGWLAASFFENGRGAATAGAIDFLSQKGATSFAGRVQMTAKKSGNLRAQDYFLGNTGAAELNFSSLFELEKKRWTWQLAASRFDQKIAILKAAHIGNQTDLEAAILAENPLKNDDFFSYKIQSPRQSISHNLLKINGLRRVGEFWKLNFQYAFQANRRAEFDHKKLGSTGVKPSIQFDLFSNLMEARAEHLPRKNWSGEAGLQAQTQQNFVSRGGLIPDFFSLAGGVFLIEKWRRSGSRLEAEIGLRSDWKAMRVERTAFLDTLRETLRFQNTAATVGAAFRVSKFLRFTAQTGLAERPPHVNELFAEGIHHGAATFEKGEIGLKSERNWSNRIGLKCLKNGFFRFEMSVFSNQIDHFIYLRPDGDFVVTVRGAFPKFSYRQGDAVLRGGDFEGEIGRATGLFFQSRGSTVRGFLKNEGSQNGKNWLPAMPADRLEIGSGWRFRDQKRWKNGSIRMAATRLFEQKRFDAAFLFKAPPPATTLFGLESAATFVGEKRSLELGFSISNLTNTSYRDYLDAFRFFADAAGRGASVRAKFFF